ncbi:carbohydrate esterase family 16 protein [Jaapia argillacea MUCL 33604]|uniref:Carbohydrate esterase family 16 protein n=1 Tax=Jaapia argillacea MUCL 33604 TaxID=933084 RepID=A0A067Q5H2_9AGAM|nr:carbohydrate esterase family 16 protein [Jaapia argillacea MUCL 33604]
MRWMINSGLLLVAFATCSPWAKATETSFSWDKIKYFYAFGDSYTFVQGTLGYPNYSWIGDELNLSFTPEQLLSNEIVPRNTSSDGSNWTEFLTGCMQGKPSECSPRQLWNFAFAGADIDINLLPLHHNFSVQLVDQVKQWSDYAADYIPHPPGETMTAWWIGINDTGDSLGNQTITDFHAFWETEMTSYFQAVQMAYDRGLNSTHLFINVPPEERSPAQVFDTTNGPILQQHIVDFNAVLAEHVQQFAAANPTATVLTFDAHTWFNNVLDNYQAYGFGNITGYCQCRDPTYFWLNTGHPTEYVHVLLAQAILAGLEQVSVST